MLSAVKRWCDLAVVATPLEATAFEGDMLLSGVAGSVEGSDHAREISKSTASLLH